MTKQGWAKVVTSAMNDPEKLDLLARLLEEQDRAKHLLREAGFGVTGQSLLMTVKEAIEEYEKLKDFADSYYTNEHSP